MSATASKRQAPRRSPFSQRDVTRALKGAAAAGIQVAVLIQPDGTLAIVPASAAAVPIARNDLDDRLDAFGSR